MAFIQKLFSSYKERTDGEILIGEINRIWYDSNTNTLRIQLDNTPGGTVIGGGSGGGNYTLPTASSTVLGGVKIGSNITITNGVISVAAPFSGSYNDLTNKPTIPSLTGYATETYVTTRGYITSSALTGYATLTGEETLTNKTLTSPTITDGVFQTSFTIGNQIFYEHGYNGFSVNENFDIVGESNFTGYHYTSGAGRDGVAFTLARTGQFTDGFGITGDAENNQFVIGGEASNTDFVFKNNIGMPFNVSGGTEIFRISKTGVLTTGSGESLETIATETFVTTRGYLTSVGTISYTDLSNKPTLFDGAYASLTGKPALFSGSYTDLTNKPTIPTTVTVNGTSITLGSSGTVTAAAGTLTGTTLNSTVVTSSLTSVGTLGSLTVTNTITGSINGSVVWVNPTPAPGDPYRTAISAASGSAGISLTSGLPGLGSTVSWTFDTTKITFPDTTTQTTAYTGNAATATKLATARAINGVNFDGSAAITVTADATTLTGTTLKSTVVNSSLTSVGTLTSLTSAGTVIFTDTTNSTNTTTGALQVRGGVGVNGNIYLGGGINATGSIYSAGTNVTYAPVNPTGQAFQATGKDTQGGTGYFDFFKATNTTSGATNGSKTMRLNSTGTLEILNSAYGATVFSVTDTGLISINASSSATDGVAVNNGIAMNANSYIFDDGNYHITTKSGNIWLNSNSGGTVNINTQMPSGVTGGGLVSQGAVKSNAAGAAATAFIAGAGAISGIALQLDSGTAGTAASMAIRDTSTVTSTMYFDVSTGSTPNGIFRWRSSSSFTELMSLSSTQLTINEAVTMGGSTATAYLSVIGSKTYSITGYGYLGTGGAGTVGGNSGNVAYGIYCANRIQSGEVDVTSDERAKDIQGTIPLDKALQFVRAVDGILYTWKPGFGDEGLKSGFSAQGVHKAGFDHMIGHIPNENLTGDVDADGWTHPDKFQLTMGYNQAIPYHHEVIKHLLDKVEKLEAMVEKLTNANTN